jgi:hypothetical protein
VYDIEMVVSGHAIKRFRERFRLMFNPEIFQGGRTPYMIRKLFSESVSVDFALKQQPGRYNMICIKHGCRVDYHRYKDKMIFVSTLSEGVRTVLTVLKSDHLVCDYSFP